MTRTELLIRDLASILARLPRETPNLIDVYVLSLESLIRYAVSEYQLQHMTSVRDDMQQFNEICARR